MDKGNNMRITGATIHYGIPTVFVAEYDTTNRFGEQVRVEYFAQDKYRIRAIGWKYRKDGELAHRRYNDLEVFVPQNVVDAMNELQKVVA